MAERISVEVAYATPQQQRLVELQVEQGASVADVLAESRIAEQFPEDDFEAMDVGIWGVVAGRGDSVRDGDRIEVYRPLAMDPRDARRMRVKGPD